MHALHVLALSMMVGSAAPLPKASSGWQLGPPSHAGWPPVPAALLTGMRGGQLQLPSWAAGDAR